MASQSRIKQPPDLPHPRGTPSPTLSKPSKTRSDRIILGLVVAALLVEITGRLIGSAIPQVHGLADCISVLAILMVLSPAFYLVVKQTTGRTLKLTIILAIVAAVVSQTLIICADFTWFDAWPVLSRLSPWHNPVRTAIQIAAMVLLLLVLYFALTETHRTRAQLKTESNALRKEIAERTRVEEALRRSESELARAQAITHSGNWSYDILNDRATWSDEMYRIYGVTKESFDHTMAGLRTRIHPEDRPAQQQAIEQALSGEPFEQLEYRVVRPDGGTRIVNVYYSDVERDASGRPIRLFGAVTDITERKATEVGLAEALAFNKTIIQTSPVGIIIYKADGPCVDANEAAAEFVGATIADLKRQNFRTIRSWKESGLYDKAIDALECDNTPVSLETQITTTFGRKRVLTAALASFYIAGEAHLLLMLNDVTDRKRIEAALQESEAKYRRIVDTATEGIWVQDEDQRTTFVNARMAEMLGLQPEDILGKSANDFVFQNDRPTLQAQAESRRAGASGKYEIRWRHKDGSEIWTIVSGAPVMGRDGRFQGSIAMLTDITARKQTEDVLKKSETELKEAQRVGQIGSWDWDVLTDTINWSEEYYRIYGFDPAQPPPGYDLHLLAYTTESAARLDAAVKRSMDAGEPYELDLEQVRPDGARRWVTARGEVKRNANGQVIGLRGTSQDITERKRIQAELEHLYAHARCLLWYADVEWRDGKQSWSFTVPDLEAAQHYLPLTIKPGQSYFDALWESRSEFAEECQRTDDDATHAFREGLSSYHHEFPCRASDGKIRWIYEDAHIQMIGANVWRVIGVSTDITERKQAEEERLALEAQLLETQKLESIGLLAGGIAHDFNNILTGILGNAELALLDLPQDSPARESIKIVGQSARRAADLTRQMLAYSGKGKFFVQPVSLSDEVREMIDLLHASISKKCQVTCKLTDPLPQISGDASQIQQVIMNLIVNASEAIGENRGEITVATGVTYCDHAYLSENYFDDELPEGDYVFFEVTDTGAGITPEVYLKLFEPFFSTKFTGRGLGLAAVMGIVRGHHGAIIVTSVLGHSATFRVLFPQLASQEATPIQRPPEKIAEPLGSGKVLVIDDEPTVRNLAQTALQRAGFDIITAADGREGIEVFCAHAEDIALVVLDMNMPYMGGSEVFREIRRRRPDAKVLLTSGHSQEDTLTKFGEKGLAGFIQKPYPMADLIHAIRDATGPSVEPRVPLDPS